MSSLSNRFWVKSIGISLLITGLFLTVFWSAPEAEEGDLSTGIGMPSKDTVLQETDAYTLHLPLVLHDYPPPLPVFGVFMGPINEDGGLAQALDAGVYWVNFPAFNWSLIEPERTNPPTYLWGSVDEQSLIRAAQNGLVVIARVAMTPSWAREIPDHNCSRIKRDSLDEFAQFLTALVSRYKAPPYNVRYWELDSEVDVDPSLVDKKNPIGFWCWGDNGDDYYGGGYFAEMLRYAYPAIKAADPQAQVVIGGLLLDCDPRNPPPGKDCKPARFLEGVLRGGGGPYFDIVSFHAYAVYAGQMGRMGNPNWNRGQWRQSAAVLEKASFLREVLNAYGYGYKGLMNMEAALSCYETTPSDGCLQTQAMYIPRAYAEAIATGLIAQAWFLMKEPVWNHTGLLNADLTPKPVYHAYRAAASFLSDVRYIGPVTRYAGIQGYAFRKWGRGSIIEVLWSSDGNPRSVSLPNGAFAYDKFGTLIATSGMIQVDYSPVYIVR